MTAVTCLSACNINITPSVEEVQPIEINVNIGDTDVQIDTDENNANAVDNEQNDDKEAEHKWVLSKETNINAFSLFVFIFKNILFAIPLRMR